MRVGDYGARRGAEGLRARRFDDALRRAVRRAAAPEAKGRPEGISSAGPAPARRPAAPPRDRAPMDRRESARDEPGTVARAQGAPSAHAPLPADPQAPPELRALARALPVAVETFGVRDGAPLALSFGRSLDVELRVVPGGVELVLRADSRLARACAAGIPGLVAALGRRGIAVARAEVRGRGVSPLDSLGGPGRRLPFVDVAVPLR